MEAYTMTAYTGVSGGRPMGRTNIELNDDLVERAMRLTGARTKREVVEIALRRLVEKGELYRAALLLKGRLEWSGDLQSWRRGRGTGSGPGPRPRPKP
jgi:Arc/MetJ family transcription regulator